MIAVDSSVWIGHLRGILSPQTALLRRFVLEEPDRIVAGDLVLLDVLQGVAMQAMAERVERSLRSFAVGSIASPPPAVPFN